VRLANSAFGALAHGRKNLRRATKACFPGGKARIHIH
jgi:hypothetical protein